MGSFLKFVLFVTATSFVCTVLLYEPLMGSAYGDPFLIRWLILFLIIGITSFILMALVLSVGGITRDFSREVRQSIPLPVSSDQSFQIPPIPRAADHAFHGFYGQDDAVRTVADTITAARRGLLTHPDGPLASFFFLGSTGVGKTELAQRIAAFLRQPLAQFHMGEFVDQHSAYRFTGAPPGYIGSDHPGQLAQAVIHYGPSLVLLLDEISLAHPKIWDTLMGLLDKGTFQDGSTGRWYNVQRQAVIIMTSNALEDRAEELCRRSERDIRDLLSSETGWRGIVGQDFPFRKAFVGRIGRIVPFHPLSPAALQAIVKDRLDAALAGVQQKSGLHLTYGEEVLTVFTGTLQDTKYGVREVDSLLYEKLSPALATVSTPVYRRERKGQLVVRDNRLTVLA
jgi:ATP-dependent Clp protease ATP-binding subunit ClpA